MRGSGFWYVIIARFYCSTFTVGTADDVTSLLAIDSLFGMQKEPIDVEMPECPHDESGDESRPEEADVWRQRLRNERPVKLEHDEAFGGQRRYAHPALCAQLAAFPGIGETQRPL